MNIKEALGQLDTLEDGHWTEDGAPAVAAVAEILGQKVTRAEITDAAPKFSRTNTDLTEAGAEPEVEPEEDEPVEVTDHDLTALEEFVNSDPMLPADFAAKVLNAVDPRVLPDIELMLAEQMTAIEQKQTELDEIKRRVKQNRALTQTWIKRLVPDMSNQQAIQAYIRSSTETRARKASEIRTILGGLKPADIAKLDPRAAIDKAFARRTARGVNRPVR